MSIHQPRDYQAALEQDVYAAWSNGAQNVLAVLPTGGGKTFIFSRVAAASQTAVCTIAHRSELVGQMSVALAREGVRHRVIGPPALHRACSQSHMDEFKRSFIDPGARVAVASVDTLVGIDRKDPWLPQVGLWIQDEAHHVLAENKWGVACGMFPNARGLGVTATPVRADGKGLGRHADGLMDVMVVGPSMRELIRRQYLTEYRIFAPPSDIDLSAVPTTDSGDFSPIKLKAARQRSHITGDVVAHYLRIARGKLGVTFDTDIESATETAAAYRSAGIPAEVVTSKTPAALRAQILRQFKARQVLQLVNVDLFGEGFDLPAIEVVSMARPTQSYGLYCLCPDTEVLTPSGWLRADAALRSPSVLAFDTATGETRETVVLNRVCRPLLPDEVMYSLESPHLSLNVSDRHDLVVRGVGPTCKFWQKQTAAEVAARRGLSRLPVAGFGSFAGSGLSAADLAFLGWFLSDGNLNPTTGGISVSQSSAKPRHVQSIRDSIVACGFKFGEHVVKRQGAFKGHADAVLFTVSRGNPRGTNKHLTGWGRLGEWVDKSVPSCYDRLTREELKTLLVTWNLGDGLNEHRSLSWAPRTLRISCGDNRTMADRLQSLCVQRGMRANVSEVVGPAGVSWFNVYIKDVSTSTVAGVGVRDGRVGNRPAYKRSRLAPTSYRPPFVWCLSNELGTLITRRNGKVVIVGNCQQFGRSLRIMDGKSHAIIIDHVGNVARHGLPDAPREWSLDRRERRSRSAPTDVIPVRACLNPECLSVYERVHGACPYCGTVPVPAGRASPEQVDGDLCELDPTVLARLRGEIDRIDGDPHYPTGAASEVMGGIRKRHQERQAAQRELRQRIALWAGWQRSQGRGDAEGYRRFFFAFGTDVATAQTLGAREAADLQVRIESELSKHNIVEMTA